MASVLLAKRLILKGSLQKNPKNFVTNVTLALTLKVLKIT